MLSKPLQDICELRTKPCQFVIGKTEDTLCYMTKRYLMYADEQKEQEHLIEIIITNKNLAETNQWKSRSDKKFLQFECINIDILSSKSKCRNIDTYIGQLVQRKTKKDYTNILIMVKHPTRLDDMKRLFSYYSGECVSKSTITIKFHVTVDEADKDTKSTRKFLESIEPYASKVIEKITLVTATPTIEFWNKIGLNGLANANYNIEQNFIDNLKDYRSFKDHNIIEHENETSNPLDYIKDLFDKSLIKENERKIIFAPAHIYTNREGVGSHMEVVEYFNNKNYCVFLLNGTFKGFIYSNEQKMELEQFRKEHNIPEGELRDVLVKWTQLNPETNLAITGLNLIERGVTFNTDGFNFTDVILSQYHILSLARLIQLKGRANGGKKYVDIINIFCPNKVKNIILEYDEKHSTICSINSQDIHKADFVDSGIPIKVIVKDTELLKTILDKLSVVHKKNKDKKAIHNILVEAINQNKIEIHDRNNIKFDIESRSIKAIRVYKDGDVKESRRYQKFSNAFDNFKAEAQSGDKTNYSIDAVKDEYEYEGFINPVNVMWITFRY